MKPAALLCLGVFLPVVFAQTAATDRTIARDGFDLHYTVIGEGRPLLLLSGGPGFDVGYLQPVAGDLSKNYQCILLEQRGTGRSKLSKVTSDNMNLDLVVEDVEALRKSLGLEKIDILGHSWGGMLAMAYAAAYPARVASLILVGPGGMTMQFGAAFADNIQTRLWPADLEARIKAADISKTDAQRGAEASILAIVPAYFYSRDAAEKFRQAFPPGSYNPQANRILSVDLMKHLDVRKGLTAVSAPALIIQGYQDPIPQGNAYEIHAVLKNSELVFLNKCGHFPWLEQPDAFYKHVRDFLR